MERWGSCTFQERLLRYAEEPNVAKTTSWGICTIWYILQIQGRIQRFWKGVALYVGHHGWPPKKILGFRWSKKAKITLETISFWQNISISILKFCPFLYTMKACQWNLINFSKLANALIRKEKSWEKLDFVL